jgi:23S rRNA pseudouridine2605 synthase
MNEHPETSTELDDTAPLGSQAEPASEQAPKPARRRRIKETPLADAVETPAAADGDPEAHRLSLAETGNNAATSALVGNVSLATALVVSPDTQVAVIDGADGRNPDSVVTASADVAAESAQITVDAGQLAVSAVVDGESVPSAGSDRPRRQRRERQRGPREPVSAVDVAATPDAESVTAEPDGVVTTERPEPIHVEEVFAQVLSGEFDVEPPAEALAAPPKRVLSPEPEAPKLHKVLAQSGIGSRRDMEQAIVDGLVEVNGQLAHTGQRVQFGDQIKVNGKPVRVRIVPPPPRIIAYHKPAGEVVTHDDPEHRPTVFRRLPRLPHGKWQSVGRLDMNTEGLLLFTNSGDLANRLMHPRFGVEREYAVRVLGTLDAESKAMLLEGVAIEGQTACFRSIENGGGEGVNHWYRVVITEGRNREVRKLFDAVDLTVSRLIRIRYGCVVLPRGLKRGVWVDLEESDVRAIRRLAGGEIEGSPRELRPQGREGGEPRPPQPAKSGGGERRNDRPPRQGGPERDRPPREQRPARPAAPEMSPGLDIDREPRAPRNDDLDDDFDPSRIPNPLEQTFDKRFVQNPRMPPGGRGFRSGGGGFGAGGSAPPAASPKKGNGPREPDPMQTSVGYIGGDAFHRKSSRGNGGQGGQGGQGGGQPGGGGRGGPRGGGFGGGRRGR